jgi:PleD family two-component response regulator
VLSIDCGRDVLANVINYHPDLILLDALMPDIDGFEVCELIRQQPIGEFIPVIMLTGLDDMVSIDRAYDVGATDFFTKPINNSMFSSPHSLPAACASDHGTVAYERTVVSERSAGSQDGTLGLRSQ